MSETFPGRCTLGCKALCSCNPWRWPQQVLWNFHTNAPQAPLTCKNTREDQGIILDSKYMGGIQEDITSVFAQQHVVDPQTNLVPTTPWQDFFRTSTEIGLGCAIARQQHRRGHQQLPTTGCQQMIPSLMFSFAEHQWTSLRTTWPWSKLLAKGSKRSWEFFGSFLFSLIYGDCHWLHPLWVLFFSSYEYDKEDFPCLYCLSKFMSGCHFKFFLSHSPSSLTTPPQYHNCSWEVWPMLAAFKKHFTEAFIPFWMTCLELSMSTWNSQWTCPGWEFSPRKPHPQCN